MLFTAFTIRNQLIRIISARDMSKKERAIYEKKYQNLKITKKKQIFGEKKTL